MIDDRKSMSAVLPPTAEIADMADNGYGQYGYFDHAAREFVVTRPDTPRPWFNYAWTPELLCAIDSCGGGSTVRRDEAGNRSVATEDRFVYIKDLDSGECWTPGWGKIRCEDAEYRCAHGLGYSRITCRRDGVVGEWTLTAAAESRELWRLRVSNESGKPRRLTVFAGVRFALGGWEPYGTLENFAEAYALNPTLLFAHNRSNERAGVRNDAALAISRTGCLHELSERDFLGGAYGGWSMPEAVRRGALAGGSAMNEALVGVFQYRLELACGHCDECYLALGSVWDSREALSQFSRLGAEEFDGALEFARRRCDGFDRVQITLPDRTWSRFFEVWSKQQLFLVKDYARIFLMGFRDTLQDATSFCAYDPAGAARALEKTLSYQLADGSALRGWCPIDTHKYGDSGVWIAMALAAYLKETGDREFLTRPIPWYDGGTASVAEHLTRSLAWFEANLGAHGLPKLYFGDWNDSLNIGRRGKGESVWLAMALVKAYEDAAGIAGFVQDHALACERRLKAQALREQIEAVAWDGEWYLRGFDDDGHAVGSQSCEAGKIFAEVQSWCVIAGLDAQRIRQAQRAVDRYLRTENGLMVCSPVFRNYNPAMGRISCMAPGWGENGSCYCHVSAFQVVAEALLKDGDQAFRTLESIMPFHAALPIEVSGLEPYAFTNMFRGPDNTHPGRTFKGWTSGTVAWAQVALTDYMLGIRPEFDGLRLDPVLPSNWRECRVTRKFRGAEFVIRILAESGVRRGVPQVVCDGVTLAENKLGMVCCDGRRHVVTVTL